MPGAVVISTGKGVRSDGCNDRANLLRQGWTLSPSKGTNEDWQFFAGPGRFLPVGGRQGMNGLAESLFDPLSLLIVLGGTLAATMVTATRQDLRGALGALMTL